MPQSEQELLSELEGLAGTAEKRPCRCHESHGSGTRDLEMPGAELLLPASALEAELDEALAAGGSESDLDMSALDMALAEDLEFAELNDESTLGLDDILAMAERNPGLKITFSY